jgi:glycosyltransferase involved in cell wall biosynthesis
MLGKYNTLLKHSKLVFHLLVTSLGFTVKTSVIFSTYNSIDWLEKVLWGFYAQNDKDFEIIIADDGSESETADLIKRFQTETQLDIQHIWQQDNGFQKCKIMNKAILACKGDYLIFTDGDCIPRYDFVSTHKNNAKPGHYLSGGYFKLPMEASMAIQKQDIINKNAFQPEWLLAHGLKKSHKISKLTASGWSQALLNCVTPTKRTWNGHNASTWKENFFKVNGFDERMQYGGEDCEFGDRLRNSGIMAKQIRYSAICVHLDHARGYVNDDMLKKNKAIRNATTENKHTKTEFGLNLYTQDN